MTKDTLALFSFICLLSGPACQAASFQEAAIFGPPQRLATGSEPSAVVAGDIDGDGRLDAVVANQGDGDLSLFRGDGQGRLVPIGRVACGDSPTGLALADVDEDGKLDVVVANHETDYLTILSGDGRGGFSPAPDSPLTIEVSPHPHEVRVADLNQDGHPDLLVDHRDGEGLLVLPGAGKGRLQSPGQLIKTGGDPYRGMEVADVNRDGKLDLLTPNPGNVGLVLGEDPATLAFQPIRTVNAHRPFAIALGDLNGDGHLDLVTASEPSSPPGIFLGDGQGRFNEHPNALSSLPQGAKNIVTADFNGDGFDDAAIANWSSSRILLLLGGAQEIVENRLQAAPNPWGLSAADLNQDGRPDLLITSNTESRLLVFLTGR
ncbi:MAG TPA: VCBS repeat-containing protein [Acidobacteriota bacterium]|nr:VCBS repeat-containing protein [Acidobacteriota bacterium]